MNISKIKAAREKLGGFIAERRKQMGRNQQEVAAFCGLPLSTYQGIESGKFAANIDQLFKVCAALELPPIFTTLESIGKGSLPDMDPKTKFLFAPDGVNK